MQPFDMTNRHMARFSNLMTGYFTQRIFLFTKLPGAWFMGARVKSVNTEKVETTIPYGWRSQNPFKSIYFAAQIAAAELSTGLACSFAIQGRGNVSMLIVNTKGDFVKKAVSKTTFTCNQMDEVFDVVKKAIETKEPQTITLRSEGVQQDGQVVSRFEFTWSFKAK